MEKSGKNNPVKKGNVDREDDRQSSKKSGAKKQKPEKEFRPREEQIGDGSAGIGGTSAI